MMDLMLMTIWGGKCGFRIFLYKKVRDQIQILITEQPAFHNRVDLRELSKNIWKDIQ
jgi:hypothetical protein